MKSLFVFTASLVIASISALAHADDDGLEVFKAKVHPILVKRCAGCHGAEQNPKFAVKNAADAYDTAIRAGVVDFAKAEKSKILIRSQNGHCGDACKRNETEVAALGAALKAWAMAEPHETAAPKAKLKLQIMTKATALSANIPEAPEFATLQYPMGATGELTFQIRVQIFGKDSYRFFDPRIGSKYPLAVQGVHLYVNGDYDPKYDKFSTVDARVEGGVVLSGKAVIIPIEDAGMDTLAIGITTLNRIESTSLGCRALPAFEEKVKPLFAARRCLACHSPTGESTDAAAVAAFSMAQDAPTLCGDTLQRLQFNPVADSPLLLFTMTRANGHSLALPIVDEVQSNLLPWINAERAARAGGANQVNKMNRVKP